MKILYLEKLMPDGITEKYHAIYETNIDPESKKVILTIGSWSNIPDVLNLIRPNNKTQVILNYEIWAPEFYENMYELAFSGHYWVGGETLVVNDIVSPPLLQSLQEMQLIHSLWLEMNNGITPKVEPFFTNYKEQFNA